MNIFESLLSGPQDNIVGAELLEALARTASREFVEKGVPLNKAVKDAVSEEGTLNNEHIKRVVELANNFAFQELFQNSEDKNIHFDVADPGVILRDLKDGGSPAHDGKVLTPYNNSDYYTPPQSKSDQMEKAQFADPESALEYAFLHDSKGLGGSGETQGLHKTAEQEVESTLTHSNPVDDVYDLHQTLEAMKNNLITRREELSYLQKEAEEELYQSLRLEAMDPYGAGLGCAAQVVKDSAKGNRFWNPDEYIKVATRRLIGDGVNPDQLQESLLKTAGALVNPDHPIPLTVSNIINTSFELAKTGMALMEVESSLKSTKAFFKNTP